MEASLAFDYGCMVFSGLVVVVVPAAALWANHEDARRKKKPANNTLRSVLQREAEKLAAQLEQMKPITPPSPVYLTTRDVQSVESRQRLNVNRLKQTSADVEAWLKTKEAAADALYANLALPLHQFTETVRELPRQPPPFEAFTDCPWCGHLACHWLRAFTAAAAEVDDVVGHQIQVLNWMRDTARTVRLGGRETSGPPAPDADPPTSGVIRTCINCQLEWIMV